MILSRSVVVPDPLVRANLVASLSGPGAPAGALSCRAADTTVVVTFDAERSAPELIDALIAVAMRYVPARCATVLDAATALATAARGLDEPELDASRVIETHLP